jgi:hypothetical protein
MSYFKFSAGHAYARANGYKGTYEEYINLQYVAYKTTCKRCGIKPLTRELWF